MLLLNESIAQLREIESRSRSQIPLLLHSLSQNLVPDPYGTCQTVRDLSHANSMFRGFLAAIKIYIFF